MGKETVKNVKDYPGHKAHSIGQGVTASPGLLRMRVGVHGVSGGGDLGRVLELDMQVEIRHSPCP